MKLSFLQTLVTALRHATLAAAAKELNLTAGAVSLQMKQLEEYFGRPLFDRSAREARPTPFAHEVARVMQSALDGLEALRLHDTLSLAGHVHLGTVESVQVGLLPKAMQILCATAPELHMHITRGISRDLLEEVNAGRLDAAVLVRPPGRSSRLRWTPLTKEPYVMVAPPDAPPQLGPVELLRRYRWIRFERTTVGGRIAAQYVGKIAPRMRAAFDLPGIDAIVAMVAAGTGVSVIPRPRAELRLAYDYREVGLGRGAPVRGIDFVCRAGDADNRRVLATLAAFQASAGGLA
ncbi:MAG: LysR family transcriptional regulator [Pseudomonadota bacterium]